jgi:hypothetical protein
MQVNWIINKVVYQAQKSNTVQINKAFAAIMS